MKKKTNTNKSVVTSQVGEQENQQSSLQAVPCNEKKYQIHKLNWDPEKQQLRTDRKETSELLIRPEDMTHT